MNKSFFVIASFALSTLCIPSGISAEKKSIQARLEDENSISIHIDRKLWKDGVNNARVEIRFENLENNNNYSLVAWQAKVDWSEWNKTNGGSSLIRVSKLKKYDRMTVSVIDGDDLIIKEEFDKIEILSRK
jgi:hypothetical protein